MIAASGAVKHDEIVKHVEQLFTKLSDSSATTSELAAKEPAIFTGSEVCLHIAVSSDFFAVKQFHFVV